MLPDTVHGAVIPTTQYSVLITQAMKTAPNQTSSCQPNTSPDIDMMDATTNTRDAVISVTVNDEVRIPMEWILHKIDHKK